jgi:hypothetical protein
MRKQKPDISLATKTGHLHLLTTPPIVGSLARYMVRGGAITLSEDRYQYFWIVRKCLVFRRFDVLPPE